MHRSYRIRMLACATLVSLGATAIVRSQPGGASQNEADAVRSATKDLQAAARRGDESALRKMWTPDGEYVDASGRVTKATELINRLAKLPSDESNPAADSVSDSTVRFITPEVAIESGQEDCVNAADGSLLTRRLNGVWVKRDGKWLLDSLHETLAETSAINGHLKPLEWLVGEWAGTTSETAILVSSRWSGDGNFIVRDFIFARDGGETVLGTQRIGWDPIAGRIKSWTFDSQGGTGEETWRQEGPRWLVDTVDVSPDGKQGKTSSVLIPAGEQSFTWEVSEAQVADIKLKPMRVEFRRAAETN